MAEGAVAVLVCFLENDPEASAVGQRHAFVQMTLAAQSVQRAGNGAGVLPQLGGLAFEMVHLLNDLDGNENVVVLETEHRIGIVQENVGVDNVIFHF